MYRFLAAFLLVVAGTLSARSSEPIRFDRDIRPLLSDKCFHCHGPDEAGRGADLRLDLESAAKEYAIVPGNADDSEVVMRILEEEPESVMPPPESNKTLTKEEKQRLIDWINQGAKWTGHWAFTAPAEVMEPEGADTWATNPIDQFVLEHLQAEGLKPSPQADRATLIRRVTYDLTGLPPTIAEVDAFLSDRSEDAYEKVVDRLLASKHFGQRMAVMWLDAARYGDTSVYHADGPRDMWAWRDTVVDAYNQNMSFKRFSIAQLAGDLLPDATLEERILSGFNRNNGTTDEGGAIAEEYRVEYAVDRVKTTSNVWLGLSMECAQCHDHKYDPISQEDYYRFYAFFNVSSDAGMQTRNGNAEPKIDIPDPVKVEALPEAEQRLASVRDELSSLAAVHQEAFEQWLETAAEKEASSPDLPTDALLTVEFGEGKGRKVVDESGEIAGKLEGKVQWTETPLGKGLQFSGNNYVDFGNQGDFERDQGFSYGGWIKQTKGTGAALARMDDADAYRGYDLYISQGAISVHVIHQWPGNAIKVTTEKKIALDQWHHVFATYDGSSKAEGIKIYVDGELWNWKIDQDGLTDTIRTKKSLLVGSRHPGSRFLGQVDRLQVFGRTLAADEVKALASSDAIGSLLRIVADERTEEQVKTLQTHYLNENTEEYPLLFEKQSGIEQELVELRKPLTTVMVMRDMQKPRDTFVLNRGAYDSPTDRKVEPGTPGVLLEFSQDLPQNRLGLAEWLFQDEHPLTARVAVNRYWQMLFGTGLVDTPADFGSQGSFPSHPELLDWLANDFRSSGWNIKRTLKQLVMSSTYRQTSHASREAYERDPVNRHLARGPRFRLQAEFVRDMALATSGLLNDQFGGPGVKPYQPGGLWVEVGLSGKPAFKQDHGDKLYRRSLYTYWKRSAPPPSMQIFDAPTREKCTLARPRTNTPLQALVVLNDPQFVEAARALALRILRRNIDSDVSRVVDMFRIVTSRFPTQLEIETLLAVHHAASEQFEKTPQDAAALLQVGESKAAGEFDDVELAAWTLVANTILNLDESITRE